LAKYGTPGFYIEPKGTLFKEFIEPFRGSKYVALIEHFKVLYRTTNLESVCSNTKFFQLLDAVS